jgi:hypothetical protein
MHAQRVYVYLTDLKTTAIFSLYTIKCLLFITEKVCVHCAVRTDFLLNFIAFSLERVNIRLTYLFLQ